MSDTDRLFSDASSSSAVSLASSWATLSPSTSASLGVSSSCAEVLAEPGALVGTVSDQQRANRPAMQSATRPQSFSGPLWEGIDSFSVFGRIDPPLVDSSKSSYPTFAMRGPAGQTVTCGWETSHGVERDCKKCAGYDPQGRYLWQSDRLDCNLAGVARTRDGRMRRVFYSGRSSCPRAHAYSIAPWFLGVLCEPDYEATAEPLEIGAEQQVHDPRGVFVTCGWQKPSGKEDHDCEHQCAGYDSQARYAWRDVEGTKATRHPVVAMRADGHLVYLDYSLRTCCPRAHASTAPLRFVGVLCEAEVDQVSSRSSRQKCRSRSRSPTKETATRHSPRRRSRSRSPTKGARIRESTALVVYEPLPFLTRILLRQGIAPLVRGPTSTAAEQEMAARAIDQCPSFGFAAAKYGFRRLSWVSDAHASAAAQVFWFNETSVCDRIITLPWRKTYRRLAQEDAQTDAPPSEHAGHEWSDVGSRQSLSKTVEPCRAQSETQGLGSHAQGSRFFEASDQLTDATRSTSAEQEHLNELLLKGLASLVISRTRSCPRRSAQSTEEGGVEF